MVDPTARRWTLLATALGFGVVQLDVTAVNVAIRPIGEALGGSVAALQWIVNAYTLGLASLILSAGALGDRVGAKRVFVGGFTVFTGASMACGLAPGLGFLIAARAVQGVAAAVLIPCSLALISHAYPDAAERGRAVGIWAACASVALSAGPLIGGLLIDALSWRAIFFINVPLGALGVLLTLRHAAETPRTPRRIDGPGQALAIVALGALAGATITGGERGFTHGPVLVGFAVAVAAVVAFLLVEARSAEPMLPLTLFGSRTFAATSAIGLVINIAVYGLLFVLSLYFQTVRGYGVLATGFAFAPMTAVVFAGNLLSGRLVRAAGVRGVLAGSAVLVAAGLAGLLVAGPSSGFAALAGQLVAIGFGVGALVPAMTSALLGSVDVTRAGVASGTLNMARQTGSVVGVAVFGSLASRDVVSGLRLSLLVAVVLALGAAALAVPVRAEDGVSGSSRTTRPSSGASSGRRLPPRPRRWDRRDMPESSGEVRRIAVRRVVDAPAARIFAHLVRPDHHPALDTSGMIRGSDHHRPITAVGEVFVMAMRNAIRGDHQVVNHVVVFEPDRAIGWAPAEPGEAPAGHTFVWRLEPDGPDRTLVTQTYDWSAFTHRDMLDHLPVVGRDQLQRSLDLLAAAVTAGPAPPRPP